MSIIPKIKIFQVGGAFLILGALLFGGWRFKKQMASRQYNTQTAELDSEVTQKCQKAEQAWNVYQKRYPPEKAKTQEEINQAIESEEALRANEWRQACDEAKLELESARARQR